MYVALANARRRCPALNTDEVFIDDLASLVVEALAAPKLSVEDACEINNADVSQTVTNNNLLRVFGERSLSEQQKYRDAELMNGRVAMAGVVATLLFELVTHKSVFNLFGP